MNEELLEQILSCPTLPSLPAVAVRVVELTQRPDVALDELAATIQNDQALAAKVLKTVNSSFYGLRKRCSTINQALVMLGLSTVKSLALGFSLVSSVPRDTGDDFDLIAYWRRGLYTAVAARCIADAAGKSWADEAFLGGLLQDIGMMAMHQALGRRYDELVAAAGPHRRLGKAELSELDVQHPDIGAMLAERWRLPPELVLPVRYHERPTAAPAAHTEIVRCVGMGNMVHDVLTEPDPGPAFRRFQIHAQLWFDMGPAESESLLRRIAAGAAEMSSLFRLNTGEATDADGVVVRARRQLAAMGHVPDRAADPAGTIGLMALVTDAEEIDPLTGVLGRAELLRQAEDAFAGAGASRAPLAVMCFALDGLGASPSPDAETTDRMLLETATILTDAVKDNGGCVGRIDDQSFVVCVPGLTQTDAVRFAGSLRSRRVSGPGLTAVAAATVSVGVAAWNPGSAFTRVEQMILAASRAAAAARSAGGNCVRVFVPRVAA
jgi:HD-like signal output (HDOD) protein/GGDEF domain-containing protein